MDPVGRDDVLGRVRRVVDDAAAGRSGALLLAGEPGIGKTTLLSEAARYAAAVGVRVGRGWGYPGDGAPGFWPWRQALRAFGLDAALEPDPRLSFVEASDRFRLFDEVTSAVLAESLVQPLLVVLDDLQWADPPSLALLDFSLRRLPVGAVALLGAYRDVDPSPEPPLAALAARVPVLRLSGLAMPAVTRLLADALGAAPSPEVVAGVLARTGGNPFFVEQVSWLLAIGDQGLPPGVREALARRFDALPAPTVVALEAASVLGGRFRSATVANMIGASTVDVEVEPAVAARILVRDGDGYRFGHDLLREYGYERLSAADRARLHAAAGRVLAAHRESGGDVTLAALADHFVRADPASPDAYAYSVSAADEATRRLSYEEATAHWGHAVDAARPEDLVEALLAHGDAARRGGAGTVAGTAYRRAADLARRTGDGAGLARAALGVQAIGARFWARADDLEALLDEATSVAPDGPLRWRVLAALARVLAWHGRDRSRALALSEQAVSASAGSTVAAECLLARHNVIWEPGTASERLRLTDRITAASDERELVAEARLLAAADRLELADPAFRGDLDGYFGLAAELGQTRLRYAVLVRRALLALLAAELDEAEAAIEAARVLGEEYGEPGWGDVWLDQSWHLAVLRGTQGTFGVPAGVLEPDSPQDRGVRAGIALAAGDTARAVELAASLRAAPPAPVGYQWPVDAVRAVDFVEALTDVSTVDIPVEPWYELLSPLAGSAIVSGVAVTFMGVADHHLGVLARLAGRVEDARRHLTAAIELHRALGARAWVLLSRYELARLRPDPASLAAVAAEAERLGLAGLARRANVRSDPVPTHPVPSDRGQDGGVFRRDGGMWTLEYAGTTVRLRDAKGLSDLAVLLANPGRAVAAADLVAAADAGTIRAHVALGADDLLDETARRRYRDRLRELDEELDSAGPARADKARAERDALVAELAAAAGLGGRTRRLGDQSERARKAVTARIRDSIDRIGRVHPALGEHLSASVTTGTWCAYSPPTPVRWRV